ncbi:HNH endonuclease [Gluconobacter cerinus]|uniref:HNH endonuclease signature motif containing protein n=1 Tax=Gluconobacter cerinus TaxID=38307 RepID=UPI0007C7A02F|nr:HNH endonuclease signature motif containing protein [Gluconobacter cerinus]MBS1019556.1 HNH endonuclease [Gluconobacter cerinus]MBS1072626.1 HNH endonuclease [Gluconobacter cerinus]MCW2265878.1 hypothetical protein [Gluconobacter cerinus]OAG74355.1 hypothetical protein A0J51_00712 [Gluconobacter japonicus]
MTDLVMLSQADTERFHSKVNTTGGPNACWPWTGTVAKTDKDGNALYGRFKTNGQNIRAHRLAYMLAKGAIPDGMEIRHLCIHQPMCCNPAHLKIGTPQENKADKAITDSVRRGPFWTAVALWSIRRNAAQEKAFRLPTKELAEELDITPWMVNSIARKKRWLAAWELFGDLDINMRPEPPDVRAILEAKGLCVQDGWQNPTDPEPEDPTISSIPPEEWAEVLAQLQAEEAAIDEAA